MNAQPAKWDFTSAATTESVGNATAGPQSLNGSPRPLRRSARKTRRAAARRAAAFDVSAQPTLVQATEEETGQMLHISIQPGVRQWSEYQVNMALQLGLLDESTMFYDQTMAEWRLVSEFQPSHPVVEDSPSWPVESQQQVPGREVRSAKPEEASRRTSVGRKAAYCLSVVVVVAGVAVALFHSGHLSKWSEAVGLDGSLLDIGKKRRDAFSSHIPSRGQGWVRSEANVGVIPTGERAV